MAQSRQANNSAEIHAATLADNKAHKAAIKNFRFHTESQFLIDSATTWIPKWEENKWKTGEGKPVINKTEFEKLKKAICPLNVNWARFQQFQVEIGTY